MTEINIREHLEPLELLDIEKCTTVGKTVEQMAKCAIGARMVGEAAETIVNWLEAGKSPWIIFDDPYRSEEAFLNLLDHFSWEMLRKKTTFINSKRYAKASENRPIIVLGHYAGKWENYLFERGGEDSIFINDINLAPPWVRDGYFKGFVNADPALVVPILYWAIKEKLSRITSGFGDLHRSWMRCGGVGHQAVHGFETFRQMIEDPECTVVVTMSGIMTMAQMSGLISYMIDRGWAQAIVATGALIGHGFVEGVGLKHFKYDPHFDDIDIDDILMAEQKLNRIADTVEPEENLDHVEQVLHEVLLNSRPFSPSQINNLIGRYLWKNFPDQPSILRSAYKHNVPVFIPAFYDSELGNDLMIHNYRQRKGNGQSIMIDQEIDNYRLVGMTTSAKKIGIFTLGGGVPRNWSQNVAPLVEIMNTRLNTGYPEIRYFYGCRICPDQVYLGHLSGCTYRENASWRKTDIEHGRFSEVLADATIVFPFYVAALQEIIKSR